MTEGTTQSGPAAYDFEHDADTNNVIKARVVPLTLDDQGAARVTIPDLPNVEQASVLNAEMDYADANGEIMTSATRIDLWPAAVTLGIRSEGWAASTRQMRFRVVALDLRGRPAAGQRIDVTLYRATNYSYRKRLIGGFYAYESMREVRALKPTCDGATNAQGLLSCEVAPGTAGEVIVVARGKDAAGHSVAASTSMWVVAAEDWWFGGTSGDRMDLLPEQKEYQPGDTARFQVRMPFRSATALVTVEREGVLQSFVTTLDGTDPIVEVPITDADAPNVFVSVLAVRGRVGAFASWLADLARRFDLPDFIPRNGGRPTALIDLSKPSYRLGTAEIRVGWKPHRLDVKVTADQPSYTVRQQAHVKIHVARADGKPLPAGSEVALAAVDEALLDLAPNPSWNLLAAMMGRRGLEVWTATAQMEVIGRRAFGRKAVPHGGGGGRERARELFDTLLTWQGRVALDANGNAQATFPLNDSLTHFRIVAVANGGADLFGTGSTRIATTQDLLLLSGVPPVVREGDRYAATFTRTQHHRSFDRRRCWCDNCSGADTTASIPTNRHCRGRCTRRHLAGGSAHRNRYRDRYACVERFVESNLRHRARPARRDAAYHRGNSGEHLPGDADATRSAARHRSAATGGRHCRPRWTRRVAAGAPRRPSRRCARIHVAVSVRVPRTEPVQSRRAA